MAVQSSEEALPWLPFPCLLLHDKTICQSLGASGTCKTTAPWHVADVDPQNKGPALAIVCFNTACSVRNQIGACSMGTCVSGP